MPWISRKRAGFLPDLTAVLPRYPPPGGDFAPTRATRGYSWGKSGANRRTAPKLPPTWVTVGSPHRPGTAADPKRGTVRAGLDPQRENPHVARRAALSRRMRKGDGDAAAREGLGSGALSPSLPEHAALFHASRIGTVTTGGKTGGKTLGSYHRRDVGTENWTWVACRLCVRASDRAGWGIRSHAADGGFTLSRAADFGVRRSGSPDSRGHCAP